MVLYTKQLDLNLVTSSANSEILIDRTDKEPLKWFSIIIDEDAYIGINKDADSNCLKLLAGEAYTSPEKVRVIKICIMRVSDNVTIRGSAWY